MPNLKVSNMNKEEVICLSERLSDALSSIFDCPSDWITYTMETAGESSVICCGKSLNDTVFINVEWFDRGQEVKDRAAHAITEAVRKLPQGERFETITVIFTALGKESYYENGEHY